MKSAPLERLSFCSFVNSTQISRRLLSHFSQMNLSPLSNDASRISPALHLQTVHFISLDIIPSLFTYPPNSLVNGTFVPVTAAAAAMMVIHWAFCMLFAVSKND